MRHVKALTLMFLLFIIPSIVANEIGTNYGKNPVFVPSHGQQAKNPCVVYDQSGFESADPASAYKMWFATEDGIALAYSADGFSWTEYNNSQPLSSLHPTADMPYVIYDKDSFGGTNYHYRIWYWSGITDSIEAIRTAESIDGVVWENDRPIQQHPNDFSLQLVTDPSNNNEHFHYCYGPGSILYNPNGTDAGSATPNDKSDDQPMTYRYIMYYNSSRDGSSLETGSVQTSLAYSSDGLYWIRYGDRPVISPYGSIKKQNSLNTNSLRVIKTDEGYETWLLNFDQNFEAINSTDGINWKNERKAGLNLKKAAIPDQSTIYGYSIIQKIVGDEVFYAIWASSANESGSYGINYYGINNKRQKLELGEFRIEPSNGTAPLNVHFEYQSGNADRACNSAPEQLWHWDFGDGNSTQGNLLWSVDHTYSNPGTYTVSVDVGCYGTVYSSGQRQVDVFSKNNYYECGEYKGIYADRCYGYAPFSFVAWINKQDWDHELTCYTDQMYWRWDFGDGTGQEGYDAWTVHHTYQNPGIYTITAENLCEGIHNFYHDTQQIIVYNDSNIYVCFAIEFESAFAPASINFDTDCTFIQNLTTIVSYLWDFGDGQQETSTNSSVNHEYANPGKYTVTLKITDSIGKTYAYSQIITVKGLFAPTEITLQKEINRSLFTAKAKNVLKWSPNSLIFECTVVKYNIYRKLSSQPDADYQMIGSVDGNTYTFTDENIELNGSYTYVLTAVEFGGYESPFSNPVQ